MLEAGVIVLCDQDDNRLPAKAATLFCLFAESPETTLVFMDALQLNGAGHEIDYLLLNELRFSH
nr:hypothetical protein [uncultured Noviherbaspirillum sp.]